MKRRKNLKSWALPTVAISLALPAVSHAAEPSDTEWSAGGDGNWSDTTWTGGSEPTTGNLAGILTGDTVTVSSVAASDLSQVIVDGGSTLEVNASIGIVGTDAPTTGLFVPNGSLSVNSGGALSVVTGGDFDVADSNAASLKLFAGGTITTDREVRLGLGGSGAGTLTQTGGTLTHTASEFRIANSSATGVYDISGGNATVNVMKVGYAATSFGTFNVSGAATVVDLTGVTSIAWDSKSSGEINVSDGTVNLERVRIGVAGSVPESGTRTATFTQSGGDVNFSDEITIGSNTPAAVLTAYNISAGDLSVVDRIVVGGGPEATGALRVSGSADVLSDKIIVSEQASSTGTMEISEDGLVDVTEELTVGPNASATSTASVVITGAGNLMTDNFRIRNGSVTQSGETSTVVVPAAGPGFFVGVDTSGNATYTMQDGLLDSDTRLRIGVGTSGTNLFDQTGGDVEIDGRLDVVDNAGVNNTYQISGGTLTTTSHAFIGAYGSGTGTLNVSGAADVMIGGDLAVGRNDTIGFVNISGGDVDVEDVLMGENPLGGSEMTISGDALLVASGGLQLQNGTITQSGPGSAVELTGELRIGPDGDVDSTYNMQDGTLMTGTNARMRFSTGATPRMVTFNQTGGDLFIGSRVDIGEIAGPTNTYDMSAGTLTLTGGDRRMLVGAFNDGTGTFNVSGTAEVELDSIVLGESAAAVGTVNLNGGTVTTELIKTGGAATGTQTLNLNGGVIKAGGNVASLISSNLPSNLLAGGVTFDIPNVAWSVITESIMTGPGDLTKIGPGKLTVAGVQQYTGDTRVEAGTLCLPQPFLDPGSDVYLYTGAVLELVFENEVPIGTLYIDDVPQAAGTYSSGETSLISGLGSLNATTGAATVDAEIVSITRSGTTATIVITGAPNTTYICESSLDLSGFSPITTSPATVTTDGSGDASFTVDATEDRKFYVVDEAP